MSTTPENLRYSKEDEWVLVEDDVATIGITDYAQDALSDVVYVELPEVDAVFAVQDIFGVVESVKAASDLFCPVSGKVVAVNNLLLDTPEQINDDPYGAAWMIKMELTDVKELENLMDAAAYDAYCATRE